LATHCCGSFASPITADARNPAVAAGHALALVVSARGERGPAAKRLRAGEIPAATWLRQTPEAECHYTLGIGPWTILGREGVGAIRVVVGGISNAGSRWSDRK
jgi:hypothetical protein